MINIFKRKKRNIERKENIDSIPKKTSSNNCAYDYNYLSYLNEFWNRGARASEQTLNALGLRKATICDYCEWLSGYLYFRDKDITDISDNFNCRDFFVVTKDIQIRPFCGSLSIRIIVPNNVKVECLSKDLGHSTLFFMKDFSLEGLEGAILYNDPCCFNNVLIYEKYIKYLNKKVDELQKQIDKVRQLKEPPKWFTYDCMAKTKDELSNEILLGAKYNCNDERLFNLLKRVSTIDEGCTYHFF